MSLPAAAVPVAVLVLAWDEAIPAVRALVEATVAEPLLDSVVVLVPAGPAPEEAPLREEFFPLVSLPPAPLPYPAPAATPSPAAPTPAEARPLPLLAALDAPVAPLPAEPAATALAGAQRSTVVPRHDAAVRVLHLSDFSLAELATLAGQALPLPAWAGNAALPAAPYVGSAVAPTAEGDSLQNQSTGNQSSTGNQPAWLATPLPPSLAPKLPVPATAAIPLGYLPDELPALDAEADAAPGLLADAEEALGTADKPFSAVQASWPQALASLREPLALEESEPASLEDEAAYYADAKGAHEERWAPVASPMPPALRPASQQFEAPDLNFQVIQYARFTVPVALAQEAFAAIYAPAWPTWLAAQELRQRTGRPLVLHVRTLAAGEGESVETATGWQAELQRQALRRADLILTETPALTRRLRQDLGLPPELVRTVPAADAAAIAQALHSAQPRPTASAS